MGPEQYRLNMPSMLVKFVQEGSSARVLDRMRKVLPRHENPGRVEKLHRGIPTKRNWPGTGRKTGDREGVVISTFMQWGWSHDKVTYIIMEYEKQRSIPYKKQFWQSHVFEEKNFRLFIWKHVQEQERTCSFLLYCAVGDKERDLLVPGRNGLF